MPVYPFTCEVCGPYDVWRGMSAVHEPAPCPGCGTPGRRIYTPPGIVQTPTHVRKALNLEEKSAHEPEFVREKTGRPLPHTHAPTPPWAVGH